MVFQQPKGTEIIQIKPYTKPSIIFPEFTCRKCSKYNLTGTERVLQPFRPIRFGSATFCNPMIEEKEKGNEDASDLRRFS